MVLKRSTFVDKVKQFDQHGQPVSFNIDGKDTIQSYGGSIFSLLFYAVILFFSLGKAINLVNRN